jgi:prevent-host-death family protein
MLRISVTEARDKISDLVARVVYAGEEVILTKHGRDVAKIVPMDSTADRPKRSTSRASRR